MEAIINFLLAVMAIMGAAGRGIISIARLAVKSRGDLTPCCKCKPAKSGFGANYARCPSCEKLYLLED